MASHQKEVVPAQLIAQEAGNAGWNILAVQVDTPAMPRGSSSTGHPGDVGYDTHHKYKVSPADGLSMAIQFIEAEGWRLEKITQVEIASPSVKVLCIFRRTSSTSN
jgi:hypothetical protein